MRHGVGGVIQKVRSFREKILYSGLEAHFSLCTPAPPLHIPTFLHFQNHISPNPPIPNSHSSKTKTTFPTYPFPNPHSQDSRSSAPLQVPLCERIHSLPVHSAPLLLYLSIRLITIMLGFSYSLFRTHSSTVEERGGGFLRGRIL